MNQNVIIILSFLALAGASNIAPAYSPATSVSYSAFSSGPPIKTISENEKTIVTSVPVKKLFEPAPIYKNTASTTFGTLGGKSLTFAKSLDYSSFSNYDTGAIDNSHLLAHSIPIYSSGIHANPIVYQTETSYGLTSPVYHTISSPVSKSVSIPVSYTTHISPLTKTIAAPSLSSYSAPIVTHTKVTPGLSTFTSHTPLIESHDAKTITYSDAPVVSHMSFSGLGASYAW